MPDHCPSEEELHRFSLGELDPHLIDGIGDHVEVCEHCSSRLDALDRLADPLLNRLRTDEESPAAAEEDASADRRRARAMIDSVKFPIRLNCPHCQNPISIGKKEAAQDAVCPACGSTIHVEYDRTHTWKADNLPTLGRFQLLNAVGQGAFGTVYRATDTQLHRPVAVKVPRSGRFTSPEDESRFVREARAVAKLSHPGIVGVFEVGRTEAFPFIVTEFVEGVTLAGLISEKRFSFDESAELIARVAEAMQTAHAAGVIHRDLKPSNIMMERKEGDSLSYSPRVMDFGLAHHDDGGATINIDGNILGTPAYGSPEQLCDVRADIDARSDVYSLGVILYELLTGEKPFRGTLRMLIHQALHDDPRPPRKLNDRIPRDLETICMKCLEKRPEQRYGTAEDLAADLRRYLRGEPILARASGSLERLQKWIRRRPVVAALLATVFLSLTSGMSLASYFAWRSNLAATQAEDSARAAHVERKRASDVAAEALKQKALADAAKKRAEERLYLSSMLAIRHHWRQANIGQVKRTLESQRPENTGGYDYRSFEWYYWWSQCHQDRMTLEGHERGATAVAIDRNGVRIATGSGGGAMRIWEYKTGKLLHKVPVGEGEVRRIRFALGGAVVLASCVNGRLNVWSAKDAVPVQTIGGKDQRFVQFAVLRNGTQVLTAGTAGKVQLWNLADGKLVRDFDDLSGVVDLACSRNAKHLAAVNGGEQARVRVWELAGGKLVGEFKAFAPTSLAFSYSGSEILIGSQWGPDRLTRVKALTGEKIRAWRPNGDDSVTALAVTRGFSIVGSTDQTIRVLDSDGREQLAFRGHQGSIRDLFVHKDYSLATASIDGDVKIWKLKTDGAHYSGASVNSLAFLKDGRKIAATARNNGVGLFRRDHLSPYAQLSGHKGAVVTIDYDRGRNLLATGSEDASIRLWDLNQDPATSVLLGKHDAAVTEIKFSPTGAWLASASVDGKVVLWDLSKKALLRTFDAHGGPVLSLAVSPDGGWIASIGGNSKGQKLFQAQLLVWNTETLKLRYPPRNLSIYATSKRHLVDYSSDGKHIAACQPLLGAEVQIWNAESGKLKHTLIGKGSYIVDAVAFTPDGRRLAGAHLSSVSLWDVNSGIELLSLPPFSDAGIYSIAFSPGGRVLAAGNYGTAIGYWEAELPYWMEKSQRTALGKQMAGLQRLTTERAAEARPGPSDAGLFHPGKD